MNYKSVKDFLKSPNLIRYAAIGLLGLSAVISSATIVRICYNIRKIDNLTERVNQIGAELPAIVDKEAERVRREDIEPMLQENKDFYEKQREDVRRRMDAIVERNNKQCEQIIRQCEEFDKSLDDFNKALKDFSYKS